jgi:transcriptional regulator of acetoin/glycerol metabolism
MGDGIGDEAATDRSMDTTSAHTRRILALRGVLPGDDTLLHLSGNRWVIGRGSHCDASLQRARVSRQHAEIVRKGPLLTIRDLGSTNGTNVNGRKIEHASIGSGDVVRVGEWLGMVDEIEPDEGVSGFSEIAPGVWGGALLARVLRSVALVAPSRIPVLLLGKTGTGKERFARALHHFSGAHRPFHAVNCAALPPALAEAELFGYRKGAFTGADRSFAGHLRSARDGVVFLDELGDMPETVQAKLLRALDTREITPLGEASVRFDAQIVSACQEPLADLVEKGRLRSDLAARLSGVVVRLPDLSERPSDIPSLFHTFLRQHSGGTAPPVSVKLYETLCLYSWPANVRELELLARQLLALHGMEPRLRRSHLPDTFRETPEPDPSAVQANKNSSDTASLSEALRRAGGNVKVAAAIAGISRQRAYRLIGSRRLKPLISETRGNAIDEESGRDD